MFANLHSADVEIIISANNFLNTVTLHTNIMKYIHTEHNTLYIHYNMLDLDNWNPDLRYSLASYLIILKKSLIIL